MTAVHDMDIERRGVSPRVVPPVIPRENRTWRKRLARIANVLRRIMGVPDYAVYVDHMSRHHPECTPLDPRAFERERLADRYNRPGSRCC